MKSTKILIQSVFILILLLMAHSGNCKPVTPDTLTEKQKIELIAMIPAMNRDLKICDLVKQKNTNLMLDNKVLEDQVIFERTEKVKAQNATRKEKRKRIIINVVRTVAEISVIVLLVIL